MKRILITTLCILAITHSVAIASDYGAFFGGSSWIGTLQLELDNLNGILIANQYNPLDCKITMTGGYGTAGTLNWNLGGWGGTGKSTSIKGNKEVLFSVQMGGVHVERITTLGSSLILTGGVMAGGGTAHMVLRNKVAQNDLDTIIATPTENHITSEFITLAPSIGLRLKLTPCIWLQAQGAYFISAGEWKFQKNAVTGMPRIEGSVIQIGLIWGSLIDF
jgi:hypothetical protein